jgi:hypothetical protein
LISISKKKREDGRSWKEKVGKRVGKEIGRKAGRQVV